MELKDLTLLLACSTFKQEGLRILTLNEVVFSSEITLVLIIWNKMRKSIMQLPFYLTLLQKK